MSLFMFLRVLHIVTGVFWAGTMFFMVSYLIPTLGAVGPDAAKVGAELTRRRLFTTLPIIAITAILSGLWMLMIRAGGAPGMMATREGQTLSAGAAAAIIALIIGLTVTRPAQMKADALGGKVASASGAERDALMGQIGALRKRAFMGARIVATFLLITVVAMALARYMVG